MRKVLLLLVGTAVLWVPAVSVAGDSSPRPSMLAAKAGTANAKSDVSTPASTCGSQRSELNFAASHNGHTFTQFYGTNGGKGRGAGANAFGKCVSTIAKHKNKSDSNGSAKSHGEDSAESRGEGSAKSHGKEGSASPAMTCKAMQADDLAHFQTTYGTRPNAFGKCVAKQANGIKG
ncbi:MAG TPA: hypothetical protein VJ838_12300 [Gaiellaceae bacterium]|nr:hypothetical protein [Gaiellaceae bacterium]